MAESVDALVSNTSGREAVPVRPRLWVQATPVDIILWGVLFQDLKFGHIWAQKIKNSIFLHKKKDLTWRSHDT